MTTPYMFTLSAASLNSHLDSVKHVLAKGAEYAAEKKIDESTLIGLRVFPDMFPLSKQIQIACDFAKSACARLAGVEVPKFEDTETTFAELIARCQKTQDFIATLKPEQFTGSEARVIVVPISRDGKTVDMLGLNYAANHVLPHFYFHCTTAYNLLRHVGVPIGKRDFMHGR